MANVVGERFQITIDKKVRDELKIRPGDLAVERVENGQLVVDFVPAPHNRSMLGVLRPYIKGPIEPITDWQAMKDRAWAMRSAEIMEVLRQDSDRHRSEGEDPGR
jgi:AbrB family looped-hinge helix DNA binding protein